MPSDSQNPVHPPPDESPAEALTGTGIAESIEKNQTVLPGRRMLLEQPAPAPKVVDRMAPVGPREGWLPIEPRPVKTEESAEPVKLEVQEFGGKVIRLEQELPAPPKAERHTQFHERVENEDEEERRTGEGRSWGKERRPQPLKWFLAIGVSVIALIVAAFLLLPLINREGKTETARVIPKMEDAPSTDVNPTIVRLLTMQPEGMEIYRKFATATEAKQVIPLIRNSSEVGELVLERWQPTGIPANWRPSDKSIWSGEIMNGTPYAILRGSLPSGAPFNAIFFLEGDRLMLDWKSTTGYGSARFSELAEGGGDAREIRGLLSPDGYYNDACPETVFQSYRLDSPDGQEFVWCYVPRTAPLNQALFDMFVGGNIVRDSRQSINATLHLVRGPFGSRPNQWLIGDTPVFHWISP